jgi:hypothetical protein
MTIPFPQCDRHFNVSALGALISAAKKDNQSIVHISKVNAVSWPKVNAKFKNSTANGVSIPKIPGLNPQ